MKIRIRRAVPADAPVLTRLAHRAKRHWGYTDELIDSWRRELTLSPEYVTGQVVYLAEADRDAVGVYALARSTRGHELEHFWVDPDFHRRGIGRRLLTHAAVTARGVGASFLSIVSDPNAEEFYIKMGARRVGEEPSTPAGRQLPVLQLCLDHLHPDFRNPK